MINFLTRAALQRKTNTGTRLKKSIAKKTIGFLVGLVVVVGWGGEVKAQIASDGFENTLTVFTVTTGTATYYSGNSAAADGPATSPFAVTGTYSLGKSAATLGITSSSIATTGYTSINMTLRLASFSIGGTTNGADATDIVTIEISPDGGTNYYSTVRVLGSSASNAYWAYSTGTGNASTAYDGNATPINFQPTTSGNQTTTGYSTITITDLPAVASLKVRITLVNNAAAERWCIDDFIITGTPSSTPTITTGTLTAFGNQCINTTSTEKSYTVSGSNLTANIIITPPANFEISTTSGSGFIANPSTITLSQSGGVVASTTIYVRFKPTTAISYSANITHTSAGATQKDIAVSGNGVNSAPTITTPTSTSITSTTATLGGNITVTGCTNVTERGIYWSTTNGFADGAGTKVSETPGPYSIGAFTEAVSGLPSGTTIYFKAFALSASGTVYTTQASFITLKPEPTNQATAFACGTTTASAITFTWTDATGGQVPDKYLLLYNTTGTFSDPVDGTAQADAAGIVNIAQGIQTSTVSGLSSGTTYYFKIFPYTNATTNINYKIDGTVLTGNCITAVTSACGSTGFSAGATAPSGWAFTTIGATYTTAPFIGIASPSLKMDNTGDAVETATVTSPSELSFFIYGNGTPTTDKLLIQGWNGSSWVTIEDLTPPTNAGITKTYNASSTPALSSGFTKFKFTQTKGAQNLGFDDVSITCTSGPTITVGAITAFGSVCTGSASAEKTYNVSGSSLTGNLVITAPAGFQISTTSGSGFGSSVTLIPSSGNVASTPVYVIFVPALVQAYSGLNITHVSAGATTQNVSVAGTGVNNLPPAINTPVSSGITTTTAVLGGTITAIGCSNITERGIYWSITNGFADGAGTKVSETPGPYNIGAFTEAVSGLPSGTTIYFKAFALSASGTVYTTQASFITLKAEPTNQVTAFSCGTTTSNSIPLTWTPAAAGTQAPDGYLILWSTGAISAPADGVSQADGAGVYNVTSAATALYTAGGLTSNTTYNFQIWSYTNSGTNINYKLAAAPVTSCTTAAGPCLSEGFGSYGTGTRPSGWAFTGLANADIYSSAPFFGTASPSLKMENTGDQIVTASVSNASQLEFWIYGNGTPTTDKLLVEGWNGAAWQTIDNVTPPTSSGLTKTYNSGSTPALASGYSQFRFTYTRVSINLGFDDVSISCITCTPPTTQATNFSTNAITENSMNIAFTRGNGDGGVMVVARAGSAPTDPASGFSYSANTAFGNGSACGSGFVVYNGAANGINAATGNIAITNLAPSTTYYFAVYEYNALDDCYNLTELSASATTLNVTATRLLFNIQPSTTGINQTMSPNVKVLAVDVNGFVDVTFSGNITLTSTGTMTGPVTVAAVNGIATFPSIVHTVLGTSLTLTASYPTWTSVVSTPFDIVQSTTFKPGDLIFIGYDGVMVTGQMTDKIYILNMVPINPGTKFQFVNSRFEAGAAAGVRTMKWCGGSDDPNTLPAVIDITYNGFSSISAGSIISFTIDYGTPLAYWVNNIVSTDFTATGSNANLTGTSGDGDQLWLTQGTFSDYTTYALFSGAVLYGMTITTPWVPLTDACSAGTSGGATRESRLHPDLECFNLAVGNYKYGFYKNISLHSGSKREILVAIMGITNWKFGNGTDALDVAEDFDTPWDDPSGTGVSLGKPFTITSASTAPDGTWVGDNTTFPNDWFYCGNWQGLAVPDQNDDVYIPSNATNYCDVNYSSVHAPNFSYIAKCKNLKIEGSSGNYYLSLKGDANDKLEVYGNLTINGNGLLDMQGGSIVDGEISLTGDWINNRGTSGFLPGKGTIKMTGSIPQNISSSSLLENFSHLTINNSSTGVTLINDCVVSDLLTLSLGKVHTGINFMKVTSTDINSITGHFTDRSLANYTTSSYINGNLKRSVAATGSYDFPVGTPSWYELATVNLNASTGLFFITASFKTPVDGNAPNVTVNASLINSLLNAGYWIITPEALTSVNYDVTANSTGHNNGGGSAAQYTLLKRATSLDDWASLGTHNNATQTIYGSGATEVITAKRSAYTGFSHFGIGKGSDGPLPVELTAFNAECNTHEMIVSWSTATETNNDHFSLERSADAQHFENIADVRGAGNSNMEINYSFTDAAPLEGIGYYRLIQHDYDGNSEIFGPVASRCDGAISSDFQIVNVTNDGLNPQITYYISTNNKVNICVYDINGRRIFCDEQAGEAGNRQLNLEIKTGAGLYFISLTDGDKALSTRVFIR